MRDSQATNDKIKTEYYIKNSISSNNVEKIQNTQNGVDYSEIILNN